MSNATEPSRQSGDRRRRRSRGGKNRNRNNNNHTQQRSQGNAPQDEPTGTGQGRQRRERRRPSAPVKLSWWQKLLKAVGLYKAPEKPKAPRKFDDEPSPRAPKSNTRVATTNSGSTPPKSEITVERGPRSPKGKRTRGGDPATVESARVYVGNLSYDVTEQDLQELFKGVGTVRRAEIVYNRNTHRSKGYGFVDMLHKDDAVRAVEVLHDQPFMGRNMIVSGANSKQEELDELEEAGPEIKASDIPLAPLPEPAPAAELAASEAAAEPAAEAPALEEQPAAEEADEAPADAAPQQEQEKFTLNP